MNCIRRSVCFAVMALGAMLALPTHAATKQFSISVTSTSTTATLTFVNGTQGGGSNSNVNSVWFVAPFAVSNVTLQASLVTSNTTISPASCATSTGCAAGTQIQITYINGFGPGLSASITMNGSVPNASSSCTTPLNWTAQAFTGNALGGTNFVSPTGVTATAATTVSCTLQFSSQPANAQAGTNITSQVNAPNGTPVQVTAYVNGAVASWFSGMVTLTPNPSSGTIAGGTATASGGTASFGSSAGGSALTLSPPGTYTLTASATGFMSTTSTSFKLFAGVLACGDSFASSFVNPYYIAPDQPGYAAGMRNGYNKDGVSTTCVPVLYTFTNNILTSNQVQLSWDTSSQPNAAFEYTINWQAQAVGTSGWPTTPRPGVAWLNSDGSSTSNAANSASTPAFIPGLACLSNKLPAPYGSLASDVQPADTTITVSGVAANPTVIIPGSNPPTAYLVPAPGAPAVPATPFPIVVADTVNGVQSTATERITAKTIASITPDPSTVNPPTAASYYTGTYTIVYNVTRGTATEGYPAGYPGGANPLHAANTLVVSTPLPIIPNDSTTFPAPYKVQTQAQMCIADHGFQAFGAGSSGQVMFWTTVIDIGDGVVKGSF